MFKRFIFALALILLNSCAPTGSAFLGPIFTGAKTGSIFQASVSYGTGRIMNELVPINNSLQLNYPSNKLFKSKKEPVIIAHYEIDVINFSEIDEPEPLP